MGTDQPYQRPEEEWALVEKNEPKVLKSVYFHCHICLCLTCHFLLLTRFENHGPPIILKDGRDSAFLFMLYYKKELW